MKVPKEWNVKSFDEVLTEAQLKEVADLAKNQKVTHNALLEIIKKDDSKWKEELYAPYLAYAIEHALRREVGEGISDNVR